MRIHHTSLLPFSILFLLISLVLATSCPSAEDDAKTSEPSGAEQKSAGASDEDKSRSAQALAQSVRPSLVTIEHAGRDGKPQGIGSGFVIHRDGLIATNYHVIGEARPVHVRFEDGTTFKATDIHAWDRRLDLAIIRIDPEERPLTALELGDSDKLNQGQEVIAMGNPQGLEFSVVGGLVSAIREFDGLKMIQLAIPIEPGNSGGPLLDMQGKVQGLLTLKSAVTENLGFAMPSNSLKLLIDKPNSVSMKNWLTIGRLDRRRWKTTGARWTQRAGVLDVAGPGPGFGGRALCINQKAVPKIPYEVSALVKLDDESGAGGLAFCCDGGDVHYGFYPTGGKLRFTRFEGADVFTWTILEDISTPHYKRGEWNHLRVRVEKDRVLGFVNGRQVLASNDTKLRTGKAGLCKFRQTEPTFKQFRVGESLAAADPDPTLATLIAKSDPGNLEAPGLWKPLMKHPAASRSLLSAEAARLQARALQLEELSLEVHRRSVRDEMLRILDQKDKDAIDLFHAAILIARLDNDELDIELYREQIDLMAVELRQALTGEEKKDPSKRIARLNRYLFEENGFHGSRTNYYHASNSYLNEVLDDREGLPITLSVLYMELARRIDLDVVGIPLPGHFVVQNRTGYEPPLKKEDNPEPGTHAAESLGFIDPFEGGKLLKLDDVRDLLFRFRDEDLQPAGKRAIIVRMLRNLIGIALDQNVGKPERALPYLDLLLALSPEEPRERLNRGLLRFQEGQHELAKEDIDWILEKKPVGVDLQRLQELRDSLDAGDRTEETEKEKEKEKKQQEQK